MKRNQIFLICLIFVSNMSFAGKVRPTKNVIIMIPDGTSLSVLSASRWLKTYRNEGEKLNIDPYLCGTVTTFSSNAPIGDSAPTTSCYMTGMAQQAGNVAIYPAIDAGNDLVRINPDSTFQPLATILEAMQIEQKKAAGLVVSCEFPHATPADCASHTFSRNNYAAIAPQMAYNNLEVMFGGGTKFITNTMRQHFKNNHTAMIENNKQEMLNFNGDKVWALYGENEMPNDIDRDSTLIPSLSQMTSKAIEILQKNKNGFFLMVEGSKIDWAAHSNDPIGIMSEYLAFDKAVGVAMEYAKRMGNTTVIVLPDHGNSGFSIGRNDLKKSYSSMSLTDLYESVSKYKRTSDGLEKILLNTKPEDMKATFKEYTGIVLTDEELIQLTGSKNYKPANYMEVSHGKSLMNSIISIMNKHSTFGFTSGGHTGEEVFLAVYHPKGDRPTGNIRNKEVNDYLFKVTGLKTPLNKLTSDLFAKHTTVFAGLKFVIVNEKNQTPKLIVKNGTSILEVDAYSSIAMLNGHSFDMGSVAVYIDKNNTFYLPKNMADKIK